MTDHSSQRSGGFPITRISAIVAAGSPDQAERARAFEVLAAAYWMPVYKYIRIKWNKSTEDAKDLTQGFFTEAIEKNFFGRYDASKARFRTFLRTCLDGFVANVNKSASRLKRGGGVTILSLDFDSAESELMSSPRPARNEMEEYFEREWVRSVFSLALERFQAEMQSAGKETHFRLFQRYVLEEADDPNRISYKDLANEFDLPVTTVTNHLAAARREFRRTVLDKLRELTASDEEFRREARALLGADLE
jgi:RNA polymerase sigma factor (sigma-70 family)